MGGVTGHGIKNTAASDGGRAKVWDAIVVGAGPAGCAAAYDLAVAGRAVLMVDRCDFRGPRLALAG